MKDENDLRLIVVDTSKAAFSDRVFIVGLVPILIGYSLILRAICDLSVQIVSAFIIAALQLVFGLSITRLSNQFGERAIAGVTLHDPSHLKKSWRTYIKETHNSDMERVFERLQFEASKIDRLPLDDIMDIIWFFVMVWATVSTSLVILGDLCTIVPMASGILFGTLSALAYYYGRNHSPFGDKFAELLEQLEYYVSQRMDFFMQIFPDARQEMMWLTKKKQKALFDFRATFNNKGISIIYQVGLPSEEPESLTIIPEENVKSIIDNAPIKELSGWRRIERENSVVFVSTKRNINLNNPSSFIEMPDSGRYLVDTLVKLRNTLLT